MRIKIPKKISTPVYVGLFFVSFLIFFLLGFPWDSVERRIVFEIRSNSPVPVLIGDAELKGFSSIELRDVRVVLEDGKQPVVIDRAKISAGLFSFVFSKDVRVSFSVDAYGGKIEGKLLQNKKKNRIASVEWDINSVESSAVSGLFLTDGRFSVGGKVDGTIKLTGDRETKGFSKMEYQISSPSLLISLEKAWGLDVKEEYKNLSMVLRGTANRFESRIDRFSLVNQQLSLEASGKAPSPLRFRKGADMDISVTFRPSPEETKLVFIGGLLGFSGDDGSFSGQLRGTLSKPKILNSDEGG